MKVGRKRRFTEKGIERLDLHWQIMAALLGDAAVSNGHPTKGAIIIEDFRKAHARVHRLGRKASKAEMEWLEFVTSQVTSLLWANPKTTLVLKEIVAYLEAEQLTAVEGPASPSHYYTGRFVQFCEYPASRKLQSSAFLELPSVKKAMKRPSFLPSVSQIADHLADVMGTEMPEYKTVERHAEVFGTKRLPPKAVNAGRKQFRQFCDF